MAVFDLDKYLQGKNTTPAVLANQTSGSSGRSETSNAAATTNINSNTIQNALKTAKNNQANNTPLTPDMTNLPKDTTTPTAGTLGSVVGTLNLPNYKGNGGSGSGSGSGTGSGSTGSDYQGMLDDLYNKVMGYESYTPGTYTPGSTFTPNYYTPSAYQKTVDTSGTEAMLEAALADIRGYGDFKYDLNADLLYQQAVDNYTMLGQQAMQDAMGQAAALTGGYGNSYAASVGNQAYQQYLTQANNLIPQFQQQALNVWQSGYDRLLNDYNAISQQLANLLNIEGMNFNIWNANESNAANAFAMNESNRYNAWAQNEQNAYNSWLANEQLKQDAWNSGYQQLMDQYNLGVDYIGQMQALNKSSGSSSGSSDKTVSVTLPEVIGSVAGAALRNPMTNAQYAEILDKYLKK